jgi:hypothetical protein
LKHFSSSSWWLLLWSCFSSFIGITDFLGLSVKAFLSCPAIHAKVCSLKSSG